MKLIDSILLLASLFICGCVTPSRPPTTVLVDGQPPEKVRVAAVTHMVETGWTPTSGDNLMLTFQKDLPFGAQIFVQEIGGQPARHQVTLTLLPDGTNSTRLLGYLAMITTRFGNPQRHENREQDHRLHWLLDCIRARAVGEPLPTEPKTPPPSPSQFKAHKGR
jgi:hypothetical protein